MNQYSAVLAQWARINIHFLLSAINSNLRHIKVMRTCSNPHNKPLIHNKPLSVPIQSGQYLWN